MATLVLAAVVGSILLSTSNFIRYAELYALLEGRSPEERGYIASDEWQSFLARAGRPAMQKAYRRAQLHGEPRRSDVAGVWSWIVNAGQNMPADAKIYLNVPADILYYYGTNIWFPRRVGRVPPSVIKNDDRTLRARAVQIPPADVADLRGRGYTHLVAAGDSGLRLIDLRHVTGGGGNP